MVRGSVLILKGKERGQKKRKKRLLSFSIEGGSLGGNYFSHFLIRKRQERGLLSLGLPAFGEVLFRDPDLGRFLSLRALFLGAPVLGV